MVEFFPMTRVISVDGLEVPLIRAGVNARHKQHLVQWTSSFYNNLDDLELIWRTRGVVGPVSPFELTPTLVPSP